jgi:hypothetical protein
MSTPGSAGPTLVPGSPQPSGTQGAPPRRHSVGLWILCGVALMVMFAVIAGTLVLKLSLSMAKNISITKSGNSIEIKTPSGKIAVHSGKPEDLGLPVYPGAQVADDGGSVEFMDQNDQRSGVSGFTYKTSDSLAQVDEWYKHRLGADFARQGPGPTNFKVRGINVEIDSGDIAYISDSIGVTVVGLKSRAGHVEIAMARIGKQGQAQ